MSTELINTNKDNNQDGSYYKGDPRIKPTPIPGIVQLPNGMLSDGYVTVRKRSWNDELKEYGGWETIVKDKHNLLTNAGRDFFHAQCYVNVAPGTRGSNFIAVTNTASFAAVATDTVLSGELASNGFTRVVASTLTHTPGTNSTLLSVTFTATGTQTAIQGSALFNAASVGIMTHEAAFTTTDLVTNDQLAVSWTLNLG